MTSSMQIEFLGNFDIFLFNHPNVEKRSLKKPPTAKSQSLLAYLIAYRNRAHPREQLASMFWGNRPEQRARHSLSTALWHINRCFPQPAPFHTTIADVQFIYPGIVIADIESFQLAAAQSEIPNLENARSQYKGEFMHGFYDDWIINERYRLQEIYHQTLARLMGLYENSQHHRDALATARLLLQENPLREDAHRTAMRAYCHLGQRNEALEQYLTCQKTIRQELKVDPMPETTALFKEIQAGRIAIGKPQTEEISPPVMVQPSSETHSQTLMNLPILVGRAAEWATLSDRWSQACSGQGGLTLIGGEAGIGKTSLVEHFAYDIQAEGGRTLWGRCYEFERLLPYQPIAEALRPFASGLSHEEWQTFPDWETAMMARLLPEVVENTISTQAKPMPEVEQDASHLFEAITRFLAALSENWPVLLVLEDLHWASESTLQLLHYLTRRLKEAHLLIVGTYRPEEIGRKHPFVSFRQEVAKVGPVSTLLLRRLSLEAVTEWVTKMSGLEVGTKPLASWLNEETEGNPFFMVEMTRALFEQEIIHPGEGGWQGQFNRLRNGDIPPPKGLREVIEARTARLQENARDALQWMSILGREFDFTLFDTVWGQGLEASLDVIDTLLRHQLITEGTGELGRDYAFTHHKIQEVVYRALPHRKRQLRHKRVGEAMEQVYGRDLDDLASELAYHFDHARRFDKSLRPKAAAYLCMAGEQAAARIAHNEAISYFSSALDLTSQSDPDEQFRLLSAREQSFALLGNRDAQERDLETLTHLSATLQDAQKQAEIATRQGRFYFETSEFTGAMQAAQRAIGFAQTAGSNQLVARGHLLWGEALFAKGEYEKARRQFETARAFAQSHNLLKIEADSLNDLGRDAMAQGNFPKARTQFLKALDLYHDPQITSIVGQGNVIANLGIVSRNEGNFKAARGYFEQARQIFLQLGDHRKVGMNSGNMGVVAWDLGETDIAQKYFEESLQISREVEDRASEGYCLNNLGRLSAHRGDFPTARKYLQEALPVFRELGNQYGESVILLSLGLTAIEQGDFDRAYAYFEQALDIRRKVGDQRGEGYCLHNLGNLAFLQNDFGRAQNLQQQALDIFRQIGEQQGEAQTIAWLGKLAANWGDFHSARQAFNQALEMFREQGNRQSEAETLAEAGLLSLQLGEIETALETIQVSLSIARAVDAPQNQAVALTYAGHARFAAERIAEAEDSYREALTLRRKMGQLHLVPEPLAGLARIALAQANLSEAQRLADEILAVLESRSSDGLTEPLNIYWICYQTLHANHDPRTKAVLEMAYNLLKKRADNLPNQALRNAFLENFWVHQEIQRLTERI